MKNIHKELDYVIQSHLREKKEKEGSIYEHNETILN